MKPLSKPITFRSTIIENRPIENVPFVPDADKRSLMNSILVTSLVGSCGPLAGGFLYFFLPAVDSNSGAGLVAKDFSFTQVVAMGSFALHRGMLLDVLTVTQCMKWIKSYIQYS